MRVYGSKLALALLGVLTFGIALWSWQVSRRAPSPDPAAAIVPTGSNFLLVTIDTLRADRLPVYGYTGVATPALSRLAREGITARLAFTPVPLTLPAHASILTGLQPYSHGIQDNASGRLSPATPTLATAFKAMGYRTGAFVSAFVLDSRWGLDGGFDRYFDDFTVAAGDLAGMAGIQRRGEDTWTAARRWLDEDRTAPFFLWVHLFEPHSPYDPPEPYRSRYASSPYDAEVAYADSIVASIIQKLEADRTLERTVVVVAGDHGEGLGDHGEDEHGLLAYDSTLRVPWIVRLPGRMFAGKSVDSPVSLTDLAPTMAALFGISWPRPVDGVSRLGAVTSSAAAEIVYSETFYPRLHFGWSELLTVRDGRYKYIRAPRPELYDLALDPSESNNVILQHPQAAERLERILSGMTQSAVRRRGTGGIDPEAARRLQALGYIASTSREEADPHAQRADPKDKVGLFRMLMRGRTMLDTGRSAEGVRLLQDVMAREPTLEAAHRALREHLVARGDGDKALAIVENGLRSRPDDLLLLADAAYVHRAAGRLDAARSALQRILDAEPTHLDALREAADIATQRGHIDEATMLLARARSAHPGSPEMGVKLAAAYLRQGRLAEAERLLTEALQRNADAAGAHYLQAQIAEARGDLVQAESQYRREIEVHPWDYQARFNLAMLVGRRGAFAEQIALLDSIPPIAPAFADVHFYRAKAFLDSGDAARLPAAIEAARLGIKLAPASPAAALGHYVLADVYTLQGRKADAVREMATGRAIEARRSPVRR